VGEAALPEPVRVLHPMRGRLAWLWGAATFPQGAVTPRRQGWAAVPWRERRDRAVGALRARVRAARQVASAAAPRCAVPARFAATRAAGSARHPMVPAFRLCASRTRRPAARQKTAGCSRTTALVAIAEHWLRPLRIQSAMGSRSTALLRLVRDVASPVSKGAASWSHSSCG